MNQARLVYSLACSKAIGAEVSAPNTKLRATWDSAHMKSANLLFCASACNCLAGHGVDCLAFMAKLADSSISFQTDHQGSGAWSSLVNVCKMKRRGP